MNQRSTLRYVFYRNEHLVFVNGKLYIHVQEFACSEEFDKPLFAFDSCVKISEDGYQQKKSKRFDTGEAGTSAESRRRGQTTACRQDLRAPLRSREHAEIYGTRICKTHPVRRNPPNF